MKYSESQINALRKQAEIYGFFNLKLSEKDYEEYQDKFCYYPPDASSETVAFEGERRKKIKEFWQEKFERSCREKLDQRKRKLAAESSISTCLHESTLSSIKRKMNNIISKVLSDSCPLDLKEKVEKITPEIIEKELSKITEKPEVVLFKFWFKIPQNYSLKTLKNKLLKKTQLINWQNLIESILFDTNTGIRFQLDSSLIIEQEESIKSPSLRKLFVNLKKAKLNPEIRVGIFSESLRKVGCAVVIIRRGKDGISHRI